jgi:hypothetical protein
MDLLGAERVEVIADGWTATPTPRASSARGAPAYVLEPEVAEVTEQSIGGVAVPGQGRAR